MPLNLTKKDLDELRAAGIKVTTVKDTDRHQKAIDALRQSLSGSLDAITTEAISHIVASARSSLAHDWEKAVQRNERRTEAAEKELKHVASAAYQVERLEGNLKAKYERLLEQNDEQFRAFDEQLAEIENRLADLSANDQPVARGQVGEMYFHIERGPDGLMTGVDCDSHHFDIARDHEGRMEGVIADPKLPH